MRTFWRTISYMRPYVAAVLFAYLCMLGIAGAGLAIPNQIGEVVDGGIMAGSRDALARGVLMVLGLSVLRAVLVFFQGYLTETVAQGIAYDQRNQLYEKLQRLSFSYYDQAETGQLLARATSDVEMLRRITGRGLLMLVNASITTLGTAVVLVLINPLLAAISLAAMPVLMLVVQRFAGEIRPLTLVAQNRLAMLTSRLEQNLRGLAVVRAFAQERAEIDRFEKENSTLHNDNVRVVTLRAVREPQMRVLADVSTVLLLWAGGYMVVGGGLTLGELVAFNAYLLNLVQPLRRFGWLTSMISSSLAAGERVYEILDLPEEVQDAPDAEPLPEVQGQVSFEDVTFGYLRSRPVIDGLAFDVPPGSVVALLGPTGSGKSTIINLLLRLYDVNEGRITVDGIDIRRLDLGFLRRNIGLVTQDTYLFNATIRENLLYAKPDATQDELVTACQKANIHAFIDRLPDRYDTQVGNRGLKLSGGEKQRLSIARVLLKDPAVVVFDEATSSLDSIAESAIQQAVAPMLAQRTSIVIAHRLSTILAADEILVLQQGRIVQRGTHHALLAQGGLYAQLYETQFGDDLREEPHVP